MKKYPCRCSNRKCRARKTFNKFPEHYKREPRCACGGIFRVDWYRKDKEHKRVLCTCDGLHYPHRAKSTVWCMEHPTGPTEQDQIDRYGRCVYKD